MITLPPESATPTDQPPWPASTRTTAPTPPARQLQAERQEIAPEDLAQISPYLTEHIKRFGEHSTHELGIAPEAYDPKLDVDFTQLREPDAVTTEGLDQAA
jgi:hypothetical protein